MEQEMNYNLSEEQVKELVNMLQQREMQLENAMIECEIFREAAVKAKKDFLQLKMEAEKMIQEANKVIEELQGKQEVEE